MSPELETLDTLQGEPTRLSLLRHHYPDDAHFCRSLRALLQADHVLLLDPTHTPVPPWQWRPLLADHTILNQLNAYTLALTSAGAKHIGG